PPAPRAMRGTSWTKRLTTSACTCLARKTGVRLRAMFPSCRGARRSTRPGSMKRCVLGNSCKDCPVSVASFYAHHRLSCTSQDRFHACAGRFIMVRIQLSSCSSPHAVASAILDIRKRLALRPIRMEEATMQAPVDRIDSLSPLPHIRHVEASRPLLWLARGWDDLRHNAGPSLAHGFLLAALGWLILFAFSTHIDLVAAAISGFLLVGPVFGAAFYELSRLRAAGKPATFDASLDGATFHARALVTLGLILAALAIAWVLVSGVLFERAFGGNLPAITESPWRTVLDWDARFYATYLATGAIFAVVAFVISAVSAPLIFDGKQNTRTA